MGDRRCHAADPRPAPRRRVRADPLDDRRRAARLVAVVRHDVDRSGGRGVGAHARDGRCGQQDHGEPGPRPRRLEVFERDRLPFDDRAPGPPCGPAPAQPSHRRPAGDHGRHRRRAAPRLWRRGDRDQPRARLTAAQPAAARHARRVDRALRDPDSVVRARPRDDDAAGDRRRRAGRPRVPVDRRHRGRQPVVRRSRSISSPRRTTRRARCSAAPSELR